MHFKKDLSGVVNSTLMECALLLADYDIYPSQVSRSFALLFFCSFLPFALLRSSVSVRESPAFEGRVTLKNCDRRRSLRPFARFVHVLARSLGRSATATAILKTCSLLLWLRLQISSSFLHSLRSERQLLGRATMGKKETAAF